MEIVSLVVVIDVVDDGTFCVVVVMVMAMVMRMMIRILMTLDLG